MDSPERFARALALVEDALDWTALGRLYCSEGGEDFFADEDRVALFDAALLIASDLAEALQGLGPDGPRRSLYLGAAVAELAPMLCESIVLGREVVATNLPGAETRMLDDALAAASEELGCDLPRFTTTAPDPAQPVVCDHLWLVSVLNDPEAFPALHDGLYGRRGGELATGRGHLEAERRAALRLTSNALAGIRPPALLTTTDEELPLVVEACRASGRSLEEGANARLSPIVGDPVRICRLA